MTRDRTGEPIEPDVEHTCDRGWINYDARRPCLTCRPWLRHHRPPTRSELARFEARHPRPTRSTP